MINLQIDLKNSYYKVYIFFPFKGKDEKFLQSRCFYSIKNFAPFIYFRCIKAYHEILSVIFLLISAVVSLPLPSMLNLFLNGRFRGKKMPFSLANFQETTTLVPWKSTLQLIPFRSKVLFFFKLAIDWWPLENICTLNLFAVNTVQYF